MLNAGADESLNGIASNAANAKNYNVSLIQNLHGFFAEEYPGIDLEMLTDYGRFIAVTPLKQSSNQAIKQSNTHTFPSFPGQQVSLFVIDPAVALTSQGLRWPLCQMHPQRWWQATLNEALGTSFTLTSDGPFLLFQTYAPKSL